MSEEPVFVEINIPPNAKDASDTTEPGLTFSIKLGVRVPQIGVRFVHADAASYRGVTVVCAVREEPLRSGLKSRLFFRPASPGTTATHQLPSRDEVGGVVVLPLGNTGQASLTARVA